MSNRAKASREDERTRDRNLEGEYRFFRHPDDRGLSVLAIVTRDADELAQEFLKTLGQGDLFQSPNERDVEALLVEWESRRFGRQLEPAAHGVLRLGVRRRQEQGDSAR